jgi:hypothetical protein
MEATDFMRDLDQVHKFLKSVRNDYEADWEILLPEFRPEVGGLDASGAVSHNKSLYDGYGSQVLNYWAKGIVGNMFYPKPKWVDVTLEDRRLMESDEVKDYLQEGSEQLHHGFNRTNFYEVMPEVALDAGSTVGYLFYTEDVKRGKIHFLHEHIGNVWFALDALGYVERVHREVSYSASAAYKLFGDALSEDIRKQLEPGNNQFKDYTFVHCIFPNPDYDPRRVEPYASDLLPYLSIYYEKSTLNMVEKSGVRFLPMVWRVHKYARQWYSYSPAQCALTDALMNNQMTKMLTRAGQLAAQPPLLVPKSLQGRVFNVPNGFTYYTDESVSGGVRELYQRGVNWAIPNEERIRVQKSLDRWFSVEFFTMMTQIMDKTGQPPTAFQISQAANEKATLLGPQIGSLKNDIGNPAVDIIWDYETRAGRMPDMPAVLEDYIYERLERAGIGNIETINEFTGILSRTQSRAMEQQSVVDALTITRMVAELYPDAVYALKPYHLLRRALDSTAVDQDVINKKDEYQKIVEQIRNDQQMAQQVELNRRVAQSYQSLTHAPEDGSPVDGGNS